ncbi:MAG: hypothetical protein M1829_006064 [Trizodia sp. TS-e1964]|nr:MAG: hypothetical protein M1829_006064 [Trizodia sp. TS-e1964]
MHFPRLFLTLASALSLVHPTAAAPPYPAKTLASQETILNKVQTKLNELDPTKVALFAYHLRSVSEDTWGLCFFGMEVGNSPKPATERRFFAIAPPRLSPPVLDINFMDFLSQTDAELVFLRLLSRSPPLFMIAEDLWDDRSEVNRKPAVWFPNFQTKVVEAYGIDERLSNPLSHHKRPHSPAPHQCFLLLPRSVGGTQQIILASVNNELIKLNPNKPALFAYRTLEKAEETWGYGYFEAELASSLPLEQRLITPPWEQSNVRQAISLEEFLPLTRHQLAFMCQVENSEVFRSAAQILSDYWGAGGIRASWFKEVDDMVFAWEAEL